MGSPGDNTVRDTHMLYDYGCWYLQIPNDNLKQGSDPYHNPLKLGSLCNMKISDMNNKNQYADSHVLYSPRFQPLHSHIFNFSYMTNCIKLNF